MFSIIYYIVILVAVSIFLVLTALAWFCVPFDKRRRLVHAMSRGISMVFFRTPPCWRTDVVGLQNIDRKQPYVIVLNHRSMVDIPMLYWTPLNFRWVSKSYIKKLPFIGQYMWFHGDILIPENNPRGAAEKIINDGKLWLGRGVCVAIFPEGTRSKTGEIGRFKVTAFNLAREAGVGVLPVVLDGSDVVGKRGRLPWRHKFTVEVLPPVSAEEVAKREPREIMDEVRERMVGAKENLNI